MNNKFYEFSKVNSSDIKGVSFSISRRKSYQNLNMYSSISEYAILSIIARFIFYILRK